MIICEHNVIEFGEDEARNLFGLDVVACQIASPGAMGFHGGVFLVSSTGEIYFTCLIEPCDFSGYAKYTPKDILIKIFPGLKNLDIDIVGGYRTLPKGFKYLYLGCGNSLLIKECIYDEFIKLATVRQKENPQKILYNLWLDVVCEILQNKEKSASSLDNYKIINILRQIFN